MTSVDDRKAICNFRFSDYPRNLGGILTQSANLQNTVMVQASNSQQIFVSPAGSSSANMTGNMTSAGEPGIPAANPARGPQDKFLSDEPALVSPAGSSLENLTAENTTGTENVILASPVGDTEIKDPSCSITK